MNGLNFRQTRLMLTCTGGWMILLTACGGGDEEPDPSPAALDEAPTVAITSPESGESVPAESVIVFEGRVTDDNDAPDTLTIRWTDEAGNLLDDTPASADGLLAFSSLLPSGQHTITLTAVDSQGLSGSTAIDLTVLEPVDDAPNAVITAPDDGGAWVSGSTIVLEGRVEDDRDAPEALDVRFISSLTGELPGLGAPDASGFVSLDARLADGVHEITLEATDSTGHTGRSEAIVVTILDNEPPSVSFEPLESTLYQQGESVQLAATLSDENTEASALALSWTSDLDGSLSCPAHPGADGTVSCVLDDLTPGDHRITLSAEDIGGLSGDDTLSLTINGPPLAPSIAIEPAHPTSSDDFSVVILADAIDPNGDAPIYSYAWYKGSTLQTTLTSASISASATQRGETWRVVVTPSDGVLDGTPAEAQVEIGNSPPLLAGARITPTSGYSTTTFTCVPDGWYDVDGDPDAYLYAWLADGEVIEGEENATIVPVGLNHNQVLSCLVTPDDGIDTGTPVESDGAVIEGRPPSITGVAISPTSGGEETTFTCVPEGWSDPDGDAPGYVFRWFINDVPGPDTESIDGDAFSKNDELVCEATPDDGALQGDSLRSDPVMVVNTAPTVAGVVITPDDPDASSTLQCKTLDYFDADGDAESTIFTWTINGEEVVQAGSGGLSGLFVRGDEVRCIASVSDGDSDPQILKSESVVIGNAVPRIASASISPSSGSEETTFQAEAEGYEDADNDPPQYFYQWYINEEEGPTTQSLSPGSFAFGDRIRVEITPFDGFDTGETLSSGTIEIGSDQNAPSIDEVELTPEDAYEASTLTCTPMGVEDPEGDAIQLSFAWERNGELISGADGDTLDGAFFDKNDVIQCMVTPSDADGVGSVVLSNRVTILNTPPRVDTAAIEPSAPTRASTLTCVLDGIADDDGDEVTTSFVWLVNGVEVSGSTGATLSSAAFVAGDEVICRATVHDEDEAGETVESAPVTIESSPPEIDSVTLSPATAYESTTLTCAASGVSDADGQDVSLVYAWYIDQILLENASADTLTGAFFDKGDRVSCSITPKTDTEEGDPVASNTVTIQNSPPAIASVELTPTNAYESSTLACAAIDPSDDDGDAITYEYDWYVNGAPIDADGSTLTGEYFDRGDSLWCVMTPTDGEDAGTPVSSNVVVIENSVPTIDSVLLSPSPAYEASTLYCTPLDAQDGDGDAIGYLYSWYIDGDPVSGAASNYLTGIYFDRGDVVQCGVKAKDDSDVGEEVLSNAVEIANTSPTLATVTLSPSLAYETSLLTCAPSGGSDDDGDSLTYLYAWKVDGVLVEGADQSTLTGEDFDRDQSVVCVVTPYDGIDEGEAVESNEITVRDSPPSLASASIVPAEAHERDTLTCEAGQAEDADDDALTLHYAWRVNGESIGVAANTLDGTHFDKGDEVVCSITPDDGTLEGETVDSDGIVILNTPPTIGSVSLSPTSIDEDGTLTCSYSDADDADGDAISVSYAWTVNGGTLSGATSNTLDGSSFDKGDEVVCIVTPSDGEDSGAAVESNAVTVQNAAPTIAAVSLVPDPAFETSTMTCSYDGLEDPDPEDAGTLGVRYLWTVDGSTVDGAVSSTLTGEAFDKDQDIQCFVIPSDGHDEGEAVSSNVVTIQNSAPTVSTPTLTPETAYKTSTLTCSASSADADGDAVSLSYAWYVNGGEVSGETGSTLSGAFGKGDAVYCEVTPNDGIDDGEPKQSDPITIENSLPVATVPEISPDPAYVDSILTCGTSTYDVDGDDVSLTYQWMVNGTLLVDQSAATLSGVFEKGDNITCTVTPNDGTTNGAAKTSAALTIQNSPPEASVPSLSPSPAYVDSVLTCGAATDDADGDAVTLAYQWTVNGTLLVDQNSATLSGVFEKGDTITCTVTPNDGSADGTAQTSEALVISNAPPTAPSVSISPDPALPGEALLADAASTDADGDPLTYAFAWYKDDTLQSQYTSSTIPAGITNAGEIWRVDVVADDGTDVSAAGSDALIIDTDEDQDGVGVNGGDCDDADALVYPGADEIPDGKDNDCDDAIDEGTADGDYDADGFSVNEGDCDDLDALVYPGAAEALDGLDNDCNDAIDDRWITLYTYGEGANDYPIVLAHSALALASDGSVHLHFGGTEADGSAGETLYTHYDAASGAFIDALTVESLAAARFPRIALYQGSGGIEARVASYDSDTEQILFSNMDGSSSEQSLTVTNAICEGLDMAVGRGAFAANDYIVHACETGSQGSCTLVGEIESVLYLSVRDVVADPSAFTDVGGTFVARACSMGGSALGDPNIAVDGEGDIHLSWYDDSMQSIYYQKVDPEVGGGSPVVVAGPGGVSPYNDIALADGSTFPVLAYYDASDAAVYVATTTDGATFTPHLVAGTSELGSVPSAAPVVLTIDGDGYAHLLFQARSGHELWYAVNASGTWAFEMLVSTAAAFTDARYDLRIDADGNPRLSFTDPDDGVLYVWKGKTRTTTLAN